MRSNVVMTDKEREKLCTRLRSLCNGGEWYPTIYEDAANEIERLAKELEESRKKEIKYRIKQPEPLVISDD